VAGANGFQRSVHTVVLLALFALPSLSLSLSLCCVCVCLCTKAPAKKERVKSASAFGAALSSSHRRNYNLQRHLLNDREGLA